MKPVFLCPACRAPFAPELACPACGAAVARVGMVLDFLQGSIADGPAAEVEAFYDLRPFPGYAQGDDARTLLDRSRRSAFLAALDAALPTSACVLDCGSGTSQVAAFLSLAAPRRTIIAADRCRASLAQASAFQERVDIPNLYLVRADLFDLPLPAEAFEVVISRGVVHHTQDPYEAMRRIARHVAPGGYFLLGFYESAARLAHRARRGLAHLAGRPIAALDPVLRQRDLDPEKKATWIADQYRHPLERMLPLPRVLSTMRAAGFEWVRTVPPAPAPEGLFERAPEPGSLALGLRRIGWAFSGVRDPDAGLVILVLRRQARA